MDKLLNESNSLKKCSNCKKLLDIEEFHREKHRPDGKCIFCKSCKRYLQLFKKFRLSKNDYEMMLDAQGGVCAICKQPEKQKRNNVIKFLGVDHNHISGKIRGILCADCNLGLGKFKDNPEMLRRALAYLEKDGCEYG